MGRQPRKVTAFWLSAHLNSSCYLLAIVSKPQQSAAVPSRIVFRRHGRLVIPRDLSFREAILCALCGLRFWSVLGWLRDKRHSRDEAELTAKGKKLTAQEPDFTTHSRTLRTTDSGASASISTSPSR